MDLEDGEIEPEFEQLHHISKHTIGIGIQTWAKSLRIGHLNSKSRATKVALPYLSLPDSATNTATTYQLNPQSILERNNMHMPPNTDPSFTRAKPQIPQQP